MTTPNTLVPINPKTGLPYTKKVAPSTLLRSPLGVVNAKGQVLRVYEGLSASKTPAMAYALEGEKPTLKRLDAIAAQLTPKPKRELVFVNRAGYPFAKPKAGQLGRWAIKDTEGAMWLLQPPAQLPAKPRRKASPSENEEQKQKRIARQRPLPKVATSKLHPYSKTAKKWMDEQLARDPSGQLTIVVNLKGQICAPHGSRRQMVLKLDKLGRDTMLHDKLCWVKLDGYELAMLHRDVVPLRVDEWSEPIPLVEGATIRESIGRIEAVIAKARLEQLRERDSGFIQVECKMLVPEMGSYPLVAMVNCGHDAEQLYKRLSTAMVKTLAGVGFRWTRMANIKRNKSYTIGKGGSRKERLAGGKLTLDELKNMRYSVNTDSAHARKVLASLNLNPNKPADVRFDLLDELGSASVQFGLKIK